VADEDLKKETSDMPSHAESSTPGAESSTPSAESSSTPAEESTLEGEESASGGREVADDGSQAASDGSQASEEKGLSPDAIAKRLEALGEGESAEDKASRLEEERLIERRQGARSKTKKGKGKSGLQAAASKRLGEVGTKTALKKKPRSTGTVSSAADFEGDALLERTGELAKWAKKNYKVVWGVVGVAAVVGLGFAGQYYFQHKKDNAASTALEAAVADERGRIGDPDKADDDGPKDTSPIFKTPQDRADAALSKFRDVTAKFPGTGASYLARLSEGSLLLDKHDIPGAQAAFNDVKNSPLAKVDQEVSGRALELLGFTYEYSAENGTPAAYDDALKVYRELENTDVLGFQELGMYHQARIYQKKGDTDKAKELLKSVYERVNKPGENHPFPFLENLAEDRLRALDPTALPPKAVNRMGGPAGNQMSEAQMKKLIEQMQRQQAAQGGGGGGHHQ
jgi:hypothetical protein